MKMNTTESVKKSDSVTHKQKTANALATAKTANAPATVKKANAPAPAMKTAMKLVNVSVIATTTWLMNPHKKLQQKQPLQLTQNN